MIERVYLLHALSSVHAGTGQGSGIIDLPVARERPTGLPIVPGSSLRGVKRVQARPRDNQKTIAVYGPETDDDPSSFAGAVSFGDARLLCLPVRSYRGTWAWVTSPMVLHRLWRDLGRSSLSFGFSGMQSIAPSSSCIASSGSVVLEDFDLTCSCEGNPTDPVGRIAAQISTALYPISGDPWREIFAQRFIVIQDDDFAMLYDTALEVAARIRMDPDMKVVARGALWYEEALPAESVLWGVVAAEHSYGTYNGAVLSDTNVLDFVFVPNDEVLQIGGKASVGRGRIRFLSF